MNNVMTFDGGYKAVISYDPELEMFRGEFVGLNGGADFYSSDLAGLKREGKISLDTFLAVCREKNLPVKKKEGRFALRLDPALYDQVMLAAKSQGMSINRFIEENLKKAVAGMA